MLKNVVNIPYDVKRITWYNY